MADTTVGGVAQNLLTIGTQTLATNAVTTGTGTNLGKVWYTIVDNSTVNTSTPVVSSGALDMKVIPGFAVVATGSYFMRMDLTNGIIATAPSVAADWATNHGDTTGLLTPSLALAHLRTISPFRIDRKSVV